MAVAQLKGISVNLCAGCLQGDPTVRLSLIYINFLT